MFECYWLYETNQHDGIARDRHGRKNLRNFYSSASTGTGGQLGNFNWNSI